MPIQPFKEHIKAQKGRDWRCKTNASTWHCAPMQFKSGKNKYEGVDTFTVVRDPYTRIISEYYYFWAKKGGLQRQRNVTVGDVNDPDFMNKWIIDAAETAMKEGECYGGHCVPLHKHLFFNGTQVVTHVLKMEELTEEFPRLMEQYKLPVKLEHHNSRKASASLGVKDLSNEAIMKINEWAGPDFDLFGYDKLYPSKAESESKGRRERLPAKK
jgi:hypothetical protein